MVKLLLTAGASAAANAAFPRLVSSPLGLAASRFSRHGGPTASEYAKCVSLLLEARADPTALEEPQDHRWKGLLQREHAVSLAIRCGNQNAVAAIIKDGRGVNPPGSHVGGGEHAHLYGGADSGRRSPRLNGGPFRSSMGGSEEPVFKCSIRVIGS